MNIGYARVSTTDQDLSAQLAALDFCHTVFQEKVSAASMDRPELDKLMSYVRKGDVVNVTKLDRLARSTKDLLEIVEDLNKRQVSLKVMNINLDTSTPTGKLMLTMLGAIAEFERGIMLERQAEGIARAKEKGLYKGRACIAADVVVQAFALRAEGKTKTAIAEKLNISRMTVHRIFKEGAERGQNSTKPPVQCGFSSCNR
jgi:DNA invertase Pin-like site-specific DNA recombinase